MNGSVSEYVMHRQGIDQHVYQKASDLPTVRMASEASFLLYAAACIHANAAILCDFLRWLGQYMKFNNDAMRTDTVSKLPVSAMLRSVWRKAQTMESMTSLSWSGDMVKRVPKQWLVMARNKLKNCNRCSGNSCRSVLAIKR